MRTPMESDEHTASHAATLRDLHRQPDMLILPNAWDVASARLFSASPHVAALATTSAGIAAAAGYPDGELLSREAMLTAVARICAAVDIPVTADLESGYDDISATVEAALDAGCAGINLEDGDPSKAGSLTDPSVQASKIAAARATATRRGVPLVINARTDVFWRQVGDPADRLDTSIARLGHYVRAGADCVFLPGFPAPGASAPADDVRRLVSALDGTPINLLATTTTPPEHELARWGIRRLTVGSALYRLAMASAQAAVTDLFESGVATALRTADSLSYGQLAKTLQPSAMD